MTSMRLITGLFDDRAEAERVSAELVQRKLAERERIDIHTADPSAPERERAATLRGLPMPPDEHHLYSEGLRRGGFVVSADVFEQHGEAAADVFRQHGAVDLEARQHEWRRQGWFGWQEADTDHFSTYGGDAVIGPVPDPDAAPTRVR